VEPTPALAWPRDGSLHLRGKLVSDGQSQPCFSMPRQAAVDLAELLEDHEGSRRVAHNTPRGQRSPGFAMRSLDQLAQATLGRSFVEPDRTHVVSRPLMIGQTSKALLA
jgi:hypothetical protein